MANHDFKELADKAAADHRRYRRYLIRILFKKGAATAALILTLSR